MVAVELDPKDGTRIVLRTDDREIYLAQQVPGQRWDPERRVFTVPRSWAVWCALRGIFERNIEVAGDYRQVLEVEYRGRVQPCLELRRQTAVQEDLNVPGDERLYPFQRAGVAFLALAERALLGDEVGTGKTVQTIMALRRLHSYGHDVFPAVCVVPNSTKGQWAQHWEEWWPDLRVEVVDGSATKRRKILETPADVYVIHWQAVRLHSRLAPYGGIRLLRCGEHRGGDPDLKESRCQVHERELQQLPVRTVVVDEAHRMKDATSQQTRAVWAVQRGREVRYRFALTGTPVADHPGDLWPIMHGLVPEEYPTRESYEKRYCLSAWSPFGGLNIVGINPQHRDEFFAFFDARFRRMPKALVVPFLPPVVYERRDAFMSPKQAKAYREMEEDLMTRDEEGKLIIALGSLARNTRLIQFASAMARVNEEGDVRLSEPSPKLDVLEEILEDAAKPVVVCAEHRQLIELASARLEKRKIPHHCLVGGLTSDQRTRMLQDLDEGVVRVLLFTMSAGGEGVNMTRADTIVRLQRSWSMLTNVQALGRVHRIGSEQHDSITVIDVVTPDTVEERQFEVYRDKLRRLEEIARDRLTIGDAARLSELEAEESAILGGTIQLGGVEEGDA